MFQASTGFSTDFEALKFVFFFINEDIILILVTYMYVLFAENKYIVKRLRCYLVPCFADCEELDYRGSFGKKTDRFIPLPLKKKKKNISGIRRPFCNL